MFKKLKNVLILTFCLSFAGQETKPYGFLSGTDLAALGGIVFVAGGITFYGISKFSKTEFWKNHKKKVFYGLLGTATALTGAVLIKKSLVKTK